MSNHTLVENYVDHKITACMSEGSKRPAADTLEALESKVIGILTKLEMYHPDAYETVVGDFVVTDEELN